jgi:hypothetical protein
MSEDFDYLDDEPTQTQPLDPNIRKQLREAEKARKELEAVRAELERERAEVQMSRAGIPESGIGALFRKAYDGPADAEAIRRAAEEYGILNPPAQAPVQEASNGELEALRRAQGATIGTSGAMPDPGQEYLSALSEAKSPEEVMAIIQSQSGQSLGLWSSRGSF